LDDVFGRSDNRQPDCFDGVFGFRRNTTARLTHREGFGPHGGMDGSEPRERVSALEQRERSFGGLVEASANIGWRDGEMETIRDQRQEGIGAGNGVRPSGRRKALKGATP
jgi:hypothetical protein